MIWKRCDFCNMTSRHSWDFRFGSYKITGSACTDCYVELAEGIRTILAFQLSIEELDDLDNYLINNYRHQRFNGSQPKQERVETTGYVAYDVEGSGA